ncbi:ABC transporter type 1, transmembrane domain-containing protein [Naematelia encephala]|uniref:ABC transporter type 1, transmembrane domain-containing protein n=1 Tax=Naematelia encephala TaxID=71784 RepID=A0A1Y2AJS6_9TREE|nr:ABC transporter type 1, transmembrane domain-containing protein [Naematelia encephala]
MPTADVEVNLEKPDLVDPQPVHAASPASPAPNDPNVKEYGKKKAEKIAKGELVIEDGKTYDMSLLKAIYMTFQWKWWIAVLCMACGTVLQTTAPLVTRKIIAQLDLANAYHNSQKAGVAAADLPQAPNTVGYGVGLAIALFVMEMAATVFTYQSQQRGAVLGFLSRASLIDLISRKSMRLSGKSRIELPNGRLTTMVSADASFLDFAAPMTVDLVVQPLQIVVGIALLIYTLGYSALVGLAVLVASTPIQGFMFVRMITYRQAQMKVVDQRVRLLSEIINNIRAVKMYAYENFFAGRVTALREQELAKLRRNGINRSTMTASMSFIPILAAVLTFITYGLSGHNLNAAIIFSGLQYFNVLKQPIAFLPMVFTAVSDAAVAIGRIGVALRAEELRGHIDVDPSAPDAIRVTGDFQFDSVAPPDQASKGEFGARDRAGKKEAKKKAAKEKAEAKERKKKGLPSDKADEKEKQEEGVPFSLRDIDLKVPRGALVCIVGRVGTGKTALLSGFINEMKQVRGRVTFGGPISYVPQHAWVQSGTVRDNITFAAKPEDVDGPWVEQVIDACALRTEIDQWADGDQTKIGEKGITLSGGQRQRLCLARAAYDKNSEIVFLDDPLSAVDAHVGHHLLHKCILSGPLANKTRVLVTHHLDVLPRADLVLVMDRGDGNCGRIIQQGTYAALREQEGTFRKLMEEFGSSSEIKNEEEPEAETKAPGAKGTGGGKLLLDEERETGAVSWRVYGEYAKATGSLWKLVMCGVLLCLVQVATVGNSLFLGYWSGSEISGFTQGEYMAVYACLGVASAIFSFGASYSLILAGIRASFKLFNGAWHAVMRSPVGWHDRTPTGRIISRLSKDIEMLDDRLAMVYNNLLTNALSVVGTFALVVYSFPYLGLIFIPLGILYYMMSSYYRQTSREVKRIDSITRSFIYSSFGEQLAGLAVIRSFGQQDNFQKRLQHAVNVEGRAYIITITIQRWLGLRLNLLSYVLVLVVAVFGAVFRDHISASKLGVVLTYSLSAASVFSNLVQMWAMVEQEMNNVERVQYYNDLEVEAQPHLPTDPPPSEWPTKGLVEFRDVQLRYRPDLPLVLKGLTFTINPGEKVGIIGRTGAGKSSMTQALLRTVEISGGAIVVDGKDLLSLGLETVRSRIALIPQDAFLFGGSVRDNIDPAGARTDAELQAALSLIHNNSNTSESSREKFKLDAVVLNEGSNFSAGERQLLSLVRALVRGCKVLLLDEATSSVDPETDAVIQRIIQTEFSDVTVSCHSVTLLLLIQVQLISIAHRLQTVAYYDRILVMDMGNIAEVRFTTGILRTAADEE